MTWSEGVLLCGLFFTGLSLGAAVVAPNWKACKRFLGALGAALIILAFGVAGVVGERDCVPDQSRAAGVCVPREQAG